MRILIAAILGSIAMFAWVSVAHMVTPLGMIGFKQIPNEAPVLAAMHDSIGTDHGLYFFPWVDPNDPQMMEKSAAAQKANPSGLLLYTAPGAAPEGMGLMLVEEFVKEFAQALIAAMIVSGLMTSYFGRVMAVTLIGVSAGIATNASYWIWYQFPADYTLAQIVIEVVGAFVAGLAIAWWLGRTSSAAA